MDEREMKFHELMSDQKKRMKIRTCFHHQKDQCQGKIKQAHSIQRNGRLSIIEGDVNGNKCIYTFTSYKVSEKSTLEDLVPVGKKEASTFFGFCDYHDSMLFSPIENFEFDGSDKQCFLHSYRSFAHSYHRKNEEVQLYSDKESKYVKLLPEPIAEKMLIGAKMGLKDMTPFKLQLDYMIQNEIYDGLEYFVFETQGVFPFAVSSLMSPKVSYKDYPMNNHIDPDITYSQPMITFLPDTDKTIVILAAFEDDKKSIRLLNELNKLSNYHLEKAITSLVIANCENTFFSPLFWHSLTKKEQRALLAEFRDNTVTTKYQNSFFISKFNFFDPKYEINRLRNNCG